MSRGRELANNEPPLLLRRLVAIGTTLIAVYLLLLTGQRALDAYRLQREADAIRQDIVTLRTRNLELQRELGSDRQDFEVERIAREELGFARPGDHPVVLVWSEHRRPSQDPPPKQEQVRPTWQQWLDLFIDPDLLGQ